MSFLAVQRSLQQQTGGHPAQSLRLTRGFAPTVSSVCASRTRVLTSGDAGFSDSRRKAVANIATNSKRVILVLKPCEDFRERS